MVPSLVLQRTCAGREGIVARSELQHTIGVHPQFHLASLQQLGFTLLLVGAHPQFNGAVVGSEWRYVGGRNVEVRCSVERDCLVLVVEIPVFARHAQVSVAGIVGDDGAFALIHLPVANQVARCRVLSLVLLHQCRCHVVSLVPQCEFVNCSSHVLSDGEWSVAFVGSHSLISEEIGGGGVFCHGCLQGIALIGNGIVHCEVCPLVGRHLSLRRIDVAADLHLEVAVVVHAYYELLLSLTV